MHNARLMSRVAMILAAGVLWGTAAARAAEVPIVGTSFGGPHLVCAPAGQLIEFRLESDRPETAWRVQRIQDPLKTAGQEFRPLAGATDKTQGTYVFRFKAAKDGAAAVVFQCAPVAWKGRRGDMPIEMYVVNVIIGPRKTAEIALAPADVLVATYVSGDRPTPVTVG